MLGIGGTELVIILVFGFLIFGPDRLPAMGRTIGRALRQFRQAQDQMNKMVQTEIVNPLNEAVKEPAKKQGPKKKVSAAGAATKPETFAEKKARLAAEASAKAQGTTAAVASDSDAPAVPAKPAGTSETFAQKKARLDAEKAAAAAKQEEDDAKPASAKPATKNAAKKSTASAAKLYGIDKDRIAAARAAAAQKTTAKEEQADA